MRTVIFVLVSLAAVSAVPKRPQKIVGGLIASIADYPYSTALLYSSNLISYRHACGGSIINNRSILSAAHCFNNDEVQRWRFRVGTPWSDNAGTIYNIGQIINHSDFNQFSFDNDLAIVRSATTIVYVDNAVRPASIAGPNYNIAEELVWAIGWGRLSVNGQVSSLLMRVQIRVLEQATCVSRYAELGLHLSNNMICAGFEVGGRGQCQGDDGSPLVHNDVIVGVYSWSFGCADARYPGVSTRVNQFTTWILANA